MENEAINSIKIAVNLIIISLLILSINIIVNIIKPTIYEKVISIIDIADAEYEKRYEEYNQTLVSGTKVVRLIRESENLGLGVIYQTYRINYAKNIGTVFEGTTTNGFHNNGKSCDESKISNLSAWKAQRRTSDISYTSGYKIDANNLIKCNNYTSAIFAETDNEYIQLDGRFLAELVRDRSGEIIGIIFTQQ